MSGERTSDARGALLLPLALLVLLLVAACGGDGDGEAEGPGDFEVAAAGARLSLFHLESPADATLFAPGLEAPLPPQSIDVQATGLRGAGEIEALVGFGPVMPGHMPDGLVLGWARVLLVPGAGDEQRIPAVTLSLVFMREGGPNEGVAELSLTEFLEHPDLVATGEPVEVSNRVVHVQRLGPASFLSWIDRGVHFRLATFSEPGWPGGMPAADAVSEGELLRIAASTFGSCE